MKNTSTKSFWLTNISNRNVSLSDLNLTVPALSSINLLDSKHYRYTLEQLQKSADSGSIYKKHDKIFIRKVAPEVVVKKLEYIIDATIPNRQRSIYNIKEEKYEELDVSDEDFASQSADLELEEPVKKDK